MEDKKIPKYFIKQMRYEKPTICSICSGEFWTDVNSNKNLVGRNADFSRHYCVYVKPKKMNPMKPVFRLRKYFHMHWKIKKRIEVNKRLQSKKRFAHRKKLSSTST